MDDCIFCKIVKGEIPSIKIYEDERVFAFEDKNPISDGHTLIITKVHAENIWEITKDDLLAIHMASKKIATAIKKAIDPVGIACLQLNGRGVNQVVMHYHFHLIPRAADGPELTMTDWKLKPGDMGKIKQLGEKISSGIE